MSFELVYDVATTSEAPRSALIFGLGALGIAGAWSAWLRWKGAALHAGVKFMGVVALLMLVLSAANLWEQRALAARRDVKVVDGAVTDWWENRSRRSGDNHSYWHHEGFSVEGVAFAYTRDVEQNFFHNGGSAAIELRNGMRLRLHYLEEVDGDGPRNRILRVERAAE